MPPSLHHRRHTVNSPGETAQRYPAAMVKVTSRLPDGSYFSRDYPDEFFATAWDMHMRAKLGKELIAELIDYEWPVPPQIVDVIQDEGTRQAKSLRIWC